jgi:hypothetical protein
MFPTGVTYVGRGAELAALLAAHRDDGVNAVLVSGEAGIGKSRLMHEFTTRLGARPLVLTGRCLEFGADAVPFAPFLAPLRMLVRAAADDDPVSAWLSGRAGPADRVVLFGAMLTLFERAADERPVVLVLEDLHWADGSSLQLLSFLVANLAHPDVFLAATHRPSNGPLRQFAAELARVPSVRRIAPAPLSRYEVGRLPGLRVGERFDHVVELDHGARPAVDEQQWRRVGASRPDVQEVHVLSVDCGGVLGVPVDQGFLSPPVERVGPVGGQVLEVAGRHAAFPAGAGQVVAPAGPVQPVAQVVQVGLRHVDAEWLEVVRVRHADDAAGKEVGRGS